MKTRKLLITRNLYLKTRIRILRCYVFPTLLYGVESWTLNQQTTGKMESFEMWCYRRMLRISWKDRVRNEQVLLRMEKRPEIIKTIKVRKLQYLGYVMRGDRYRILKLIIEGKIQGSRSVGRRTSWLRNLREWYKVSSIELFRSAVSRVKIAMMISKLR